MDKSDWKGGEEMNPKRCTGEAGSVACERDSVSKRAARIEVATGELVIRLRLLRSKLCITLENECAKSEDEDMCLMDVLASAEQNLKDIFAIFTDIEQAIG